MPLIDDLVTKIAAVPMQQDGSLVLSDSTFTGLDFAPLFFTQVIRATSFTIGKADRKTATGSATIKGIADCFGYKGLSVTLGFSATDGEVTISLDGTFDPGKRTTLPVLNWIDVGNLGLTATISQPFAIVTFSYHGAIALKGDSAPSTPITLTPTLEDGGWQLEVAGDLSQGLTGAQLVALLSGNALTSFLPQDVVDKLAGFKLTGIAATFNLTAKTVSLLSVSITVTNGWDILPQFSLAPNMSISFLATDITDPSSRTLVGVVKSTFVVAGVPVPIFVQGQVGPSPGAAWLIGLDPESTGVTLPSLSNLFDLSGDPSFKNSLPSGLAHLPGINIFELQVGFTTGPTTLQRIAFGAQTTAPWPVIDGFLTIDALSFQMDLLNLSDTPNRQIGVSFASRFLIGNTVFLYFTINKDPASPDWVLAGGLAKGTSLNFTDLVAKLLSSYVTIPANAPQIVLDQADITVIPAKSMNFTAGSNTPWTLITGKLTLNSFTLTFDYKKENSAAPFSGSLATQITIAKVPFKISAQLSSGSGGWQFEGKTAQGAQINVLDLINDLGSVFGVTAPNAISQFTLQDIDLKLVSSTNANQPGASSFHFACSSDVTLAGARLHGSVIIDLTRSALGGYDKKFTGTLTITTASGTTETFTLLFVDDAQGSKLTATWTPSKALTFEDIASAFKFSMPAIPEELDLSLTGAGFAYNFTTGELIFSASSKHYGQLAFASRIVNSQRVYVFDLAVSLNVKLSNLPAVGSQIPPSIDVGIQSIEVAYASAKLLAGDVTAINKDLEAINAKPLGPATLDQGVAFFGQMQLGAQQLPLNVPLSSSSSTSQGGGTNITAAPAIPASPTAPGKWFDVGKSFGPLQINRVGVQYENSTLMFALDAGLAFGPLAFSVDGLAVGSPLTNFSPVFSIRGLGLSYNQPPLEISGAILKVDNPPPPVKYQFDGMVVLKAAGWSLAAIASYAQLTTGESSLFVFAQLQYPIGGPPALFVTGLMAGFGFNRTLTIPAQDEVESFPLLLLAASSGPGKPAAQPTDVLGYLEGSKAPAGGTKKAWITAQPGQYWLAAGLMFTSFEIVHTRALLVVEFGNKLLIAILGLSTLQLPQPEESSLTYAYVELMLRVVLDPTEGYFSATAILSKNSYVITPDCHLTGGFAFVFWFGSHTNAGQFVITLGGYHPAFKPPDGFPLVPRLGFNWAVSDTVTVKGTAYFALTTSCVMAGGGLEVLFHDGDLQAWFTAHADFLVSWHPFFYLAEIGVSIGASYRLNLLFCHKTITVSLGAQLNLWGPPTGGKVRVDLVVVSFTVHFGSDSAGQQKNPLQWGDFKALLPDPSSVCRINVNEGLYKTANAPENSSGKLWVVRARRFSFSTQASIPASHLQYGDSSTQLRAVADAGISIRPMNLTGVTSTHTLKIFKKGSATPVPSAGWTMTPAHQSVPASLWGAPPAPFTQIPAVPTADVVPGQTSGYAVTAPEPQIGDTRGALALKLLAEEYLTPPGKAPLSQSPTPTADYLPIFAKNTVGLIQQINIGTASSNRVGLFQTLTNSQLFAGVSDPLPLLASGAAHLYSDAPMQQN